MGQGKHPIGRGSGGNFCERMNPPDMDLVLVRAVAKNRGPWTTGPPLPCSSAAHSSLKASRRRARAHKWWAPVALSRVTRWGA
jgi:hypothetical protein